MKKIKFRYVWKSRIDGHIWTEIVPIECLEGDGDTPFIHRDRREFEMLARNLYTGLKDKNGNDIYEGDILETIHFCEGEYSVVSFNERGIYVAHHPQEKEDWCLLDDYDFEVVGNIYENEDLLDKST